MNTKRPNSTKGNSWVKATLLLSSCALYAGCTGGGSITSGTSSSSVTGSLALTSVYPSASGSSWTPIISAGMYYIKGLALTVVGTCSTTVTSVTVNEGGANYSETATCLADGTFTWNKTYTSGSGEGNKTLTFQGVDGSGNTINGATVTQQVRIDNTAPSVPVVTSPASSPYTYTGSTTTTTISGTCSTDTYQIVGGAVGGTTTVITPSSGTWSYTATLADGATTTFAFYASDLAGNTAAAVDQQILWEPTLGLVISGTAPASGRVTDGSTNYVLQATANNLPSSTTDGTTNYVLKTGFNSIISAGAN